MKTLVLSVLFFFGAFDQGHADQLIFCTDQMQCSTLAEGEQVLAALNANLTACQGGIDPGCMRECRINFNDCRRNGGSLNTCAAIRAGCETHCRK